MRTATCSSRARKLTAPEIEQILHEIEQALDYAAAAAGETFDDLRRRVRAALEGNRPNRPGGKQTIVRDLPLSALGVASAAGALLGLATGRSREKAG